MTTENALCLNDDENSKNNRYDSAWKTVIKTWFSDFLAFFFPDIHRAIDFSKKPVFLDKEMQEIDPDSTMGDREADILVKVHLKDGTTQYIGILIHVEVQAQPVPGFMERMFVYFYRAFDQNKIERIPVISIALLTDDNPVYRPHEYAFDLFGFQLRMRIPMVKIIDFRPGGPLREKLETSKSHMTMIVNAQLKSLEVKKKGNRRKFEAAKEMIRQCYSRGYDKDGVRQIMKFIAWVIRLPESYKKEIKKFIKITEEEYKMEFVPLWEIDSREEGRMEGRMEGRVEGRNEGRKEGRLEGSIEGKRKMAAKLLQKGVPVDVVAEAAELPIEEIKKLMPTVH